MTAGPMKCDQTAKVGSAVPSAPRWACGVVDTYIRKSVNFAKIVAASHALSLSPWPPLHTMERGERGVRAGRAHFLSAFPLSIGWRGGRGVRLATSCTCRPFHPRVSIFGSGCAGLGAGRPSSTTNQSGWDR